ncbi:MAG: hypothetical protein K2X39_09550, partial [Silvanigrellaceae bacterium]|nr:hypothetical protein [Silvanigrellaceae bacterium]
MQKISLLFMETLFALMWQALKAVNILTICVGVSVIAEADYLLLFLCLSCMYTFFMFGLYIFVRTFYSIIYFWLRTFLMAEWLLDKVNDAFETILEKKEMKEQMPIWIGLIIHGVASWTIVLDLFMMLFGFTLIFGILCLICYCAFAPSQPSRVSLEPKREGKKEIVFVKVFYKKTKQENDKFLLSFLLWFAALLVVASLTVMVIVAPVLVNASRHPSMNTVKNMESNCLMIRSGESPRFARPRQRIIGFDFVVLPFTFSGDSFDSQFELQKKYNVTVTGNVGYFHFVMPGYATLAVLRKGLEDSLGRKQLLPGYFCFNTVPLRENLPINLLFPMADVNVIYKDLRDELMGGIKINKKKTKLKKRERESSPEHVDYSMQNLRDIVLTASDEQQRQWWIHWTRCGSSTGNESMKLDPDCSALVWEGKSQQEWFTAATAALETWGGIPPDNFIDDFRTEIARFENERVSNAAALVQQNERLQKKVSLAKSDGLIVDQAVKRNDGARTELKSAYDLKN